MKKIIVACDSFKGCLSSKEIARTIAEAISQVDATIDVVEIPIADGGEGTVEALAAAAPEPIKRVTCTVDAPLPELPQVEATYIVTESGCAFMELAQASGLPLVPRDQRDIMRASTLGTGQMILHAITNGCTEIALGLGGSATCDGGMGLLAALGVEFFDSDMHHLMPCAANLGKIAEIDCHGLNPEAADAKISLIIDVDNPLCGPRGAAHVFAPQKGASLEQVEQLEQMMLHYATFLGNTASLAGAGAAGGVVAGMKAVLPQCRLMPGANYVLDMARFDEMVTDASLVITGEGRVDAQTAMGKAPGSVRQRAAEHGVPVVAICGAVAPNLDSNALGFSQIIPVTPVDMPLEEAMRPDVARQNITHTVRRLLNYNN